MNILKPSPSFLLSCVIALLARDIRSFRLELISPDGVTTNPRYLYSLTVLIVVTSILKFRLINLPVLLNIIHLVFSVLILREFCFAYTLSFDNLLVNPSSVLERRIRSSAHNIQLSCFPSPILGDSWSDDFIATGKSARKILKRSGLSKCSLVWRPLLG